MVGLALGAVSALGAAGNFVSGMFSASARQAQIAEQVRQVRLKKDYTVGLTRAMANASGFTPGSASTVEYLKSMTKEFDSSIDNIQQTGSAIGAADTIGAFAGLAEGAAKTYGSLATANGWKF